MKFLPSLVLGCLAALAQFASGAITLPRMFDDHMVLQQDTNANFWGRAIAGETITVSSDWPEAASVSTQAGPDGKWSLKLPTPPAPSNQSGYTVTLTGSQSPKLQFEDVLIGEVWLLTGQSNMEVSLAGWPNDNPPALVEGSAEAIAAADFPQIRLLASFHKSANEPQEDMTTQWGATHWTACSPSTARDFSAVGYFFGRDIHQALDVPVGLLQVCWWGSACEAWLPPADLQRVADYRGQGPWTSTGTEDNFTPTVIYNGTLSPVIPFTIRGALWYQGETNIGRDRQLTQLLPAMINGWRREWGQGDFPFYLANIAPWDQYWQLQAPEFWEAQASVLHLPNTGLALTLDLGDAKNIHPPKKREIGERFARLAKSKTYGLTGFAENGPIYRSHEIEGDTLTLAFDHPGAGLKASPDGLPGFELAGADGVFHPATATIASADTVELRSDSVPAPVQARYAWARMPVASLLNSDDLPAASFRTHPPAHLPSHFGRALRPSATPDAVPFTRLNLLHDSTGDLPRLAGTTLELTVDTTDAIQQIAALIHANIVRLSLPNNGEPNAQAALIEQALQRCLAFELVPVLSLDANSQQTLLQASAAWTATPVKAILQHYQRYLFLEIAHNPAASSTSSWQADAFAAIAAIRQAGIESPLLVEAPNADDLLAGRQAIAQSDPLANTAFTLPLDGANYDVADALDALGAAQVPVLASSIAPTNTAVQFAALDANRYGFLAGSWLGDDPHAADSADLVNANGLTPLGQAYVDSPQSIATLARPSQAATEAFLYERWAELVDWQQADSSPDADPDLDGLANQFESLLGLNPLAPDSGRFLYPESTADSAPRFSLRLGAAADRNASLSVCVSNDLADWTDLQLAFDPDSRSWSLSDGLATAWPLESIRQPDGTHLLRIQPAAQPAFIKAQLAEPTQ